MALDSETFELFAAGVKALNKIGDNIDSPRDSREDVFTSGNINVVDALLAIAEAIEKLANAVREIEP